MKQFILDNPVESILLVILLCILLGIIMYRLYKRFYDHQLNLVLQKKKRMHLISPHSVAWIWSCCSILFVVIVGSMIVFMPDEDNIETCIPSDTVMVAYNKSDIEEEIKSIRENSKSVSIQEEHPNQHVTITYAINDRGEYVYAVVYDLLRNPKENEHFVISMMESSGFIVTENELTTQNIIYISKGNVDVSCDGQRRKIHIYNYVKGENTDPIDYYDEYTIEKGGIKR